MFKLLATCGLNSHPLRIVYYRSQVLNIFLPTPPTISSILGLWFGQGVFLLLSSEQSLPDPLHGLHGDTGVQENYLTRINSYQGTEELLSFCITIILIDAEQTSYVQEEFLE